MNWAPVPAPPFPVHCTYTGYSTSSHSESKHGVLWGQTEPQCAHSLSPGGKVKRPLSMDSPGSGVTPFRRGNATFMSNAVWNQESSAVIYHSCSDVSLTCLTFSLQISLISSLATALMLRGKCKDLSNTLLLSLSLRPLFFLSRSWASLATLDFNISYAPLHGIRQMLWSFFLSTT